MRRQKEEKEKKKKEQTDGETGEGGSDDDEGTSDKNGDNQEEEEFDDEEDYLFRVYFKDDEIEYAMERQKFDHFDELLDLKQEATAEASDYLQSNKINISEFVPKDVKSTRDIMRNARRGGIIANSELPGIDEEEESAKGDENVESLQRKFTGKKMDREM